MAQALRSTRVLTADGLTPATLIVEGEKIALSGLGTMSALPRNATTLHGLQAERHDGR